MTEVVVDTNVAVVANDVSGWPAECVNACIDELITLMEDGIAVVDNQRLLISEYDRNLRSEGQPGIGDVFLRWLLTNIENPDRCRQVTITPKGDTFLEVADLTFDADDLKFLAVARVSGAVVLEATDTEWWRRSADLAESGIRVHFVCAQLIESLAES